MVQKKRILVVEDNEFNREMLSEILSEKYQVLEAENGQAALEVLGQQKDCVALILLDVMMPVMDGYTFLDRIKEDAELALIPVIVMTQSDGEDDEIAALAHGATDFVPKPYRPQVILHRVASLIKLRETAAMVNQFQYDRLTGLYSKEFFYQKVRERLDENPDREYTIVCSNIENFKVYNDTFGRAEGDRLLKVFADSAREFITGEGICGRYSADRFLILQEREQERKAREALLREEKPNHRDKMKKISVKWGVYDITDRTTPIEQMCDRALLAADSIRGQYNQYIAVYDDALRAKLLREKAITDVMETALAEGQFVVYLQPKYSLNDNCMAGAEALVRWIHPEWGFMSPGEFIPLFEKNGFIPRLDQYVWEQVCICLRDWKQKGYPLLPISVNVSRSDVYQAHLVETLLELTEKYGVEPAYLHLEITESAYTENPAQIISTVEKLRKRGFIIEMDDFGSGYSSLNMFSQMTLDILKLDMTFIRSEMAKSADQSILNDIVSMAHRLYLSVVAEGVETLEQVNRLRAIGCDYVQGYFFAKPMPVPEFEALLRTRQLHDTLMLPKDSLREKNKRCLLVVDDDAGYRARVRKNFEGQYRIMEAADAYSAIACISSYEYESISAIMLSMTLPKDSIAELLKVLHQEPAFWKIPVLATIPNGESMEAYPLAAETDDFLCKCHPLFDLRRRIDHLMDAVRTHERESALMDEASRDYLTGLLNRRGLQAAIASLRKEEQPLAVYLFDLDNLKQVNDTCGHEMGDRMIQSFADLLRRSTRSGDILCRYGGDEFVVILKCMDQVDSVLKKGEGICRKFRDCFADEPFDAACSAGVVLCGTQETPSSKMIEHADEALYRAKREKKGNCCLWGEQ